MTVPITGSVKDVTGVEDNDTPWSFASVIRFAEDGSVITEKPREVRAVSGNLKVNLVPGYAIVTYGKHVWQVDVPETATTLKALIEAGIAFPPDTDQIRLDAAVGQYVETHREQFRSYAVPVVGDPSMVQWFDALGVEIGDPQPWWTVTTVPWGGITDRPAEYSGGVGDGIADDYSAIAAADTSAATSGVPILFKKGTYRIASNLTVNSPVELQPGALIKPGSGVTVTFSGGVHAPLSKVFDLSAGGVVVVRNVPALYPQWWGAVGDGSTDDRDAIQFAFDAASLLAAGTGQRGKVIIPPGVYRCNDWIFPKSNTVIENQGHLKFYGGDSIGGFVVILFQQNIEMYGGIWDSNHQYNDNTIALSYLDPTEWPQPQGGDYVENVYIHDMLIKGARAGIPSSYDVNDPSNVGIGGGKGITIQYGCKNILVSDVVIDDCDIGITVEGRDGTSSDPLITDPGLSQNIVIQNTVIQNAKWSGLFLVAVANSWASYGGVSGISLSNIEIVDCGIGQNTFESSTIDVATLFGSITASPAIGVQATNVRIRSTTGKMTAIRGGMRLCKLDLQVSAAGELLAVHNTNGHGGFGGGGTFASRYNVVRAQVGLIGSAFSGYLLNSQLSAGAASALHSRYEFDVIHVSGSTPTTVPVANYVNNLPTTTSMRVTDLNTGKTTHIGAGTDPSLTSSVGSLLHNGLAIADDAANNLTRLAAVRDALALQDKNGVTRAKITTTLMQILTGLGFNSDTTGIFFGTGSPEGVKSAGAGSIYHNTSGSGYATYEKRTGSGNTGWKALGAPDIQVFTASGTWTKPAWATSVTITALGGGGGGGSGRRGSSGITLFGGCGGAGGGWSSATFDASELNSTESITVGAGGSGGPAVTTDDTSGSAGVAGGVSLFGAKVRSAGGAGGSGGGTSAASAAAGGAGQVAGANGPVNSATTGVNGTSSSAGPSGGSGGGLATTPVATAGGNGGFNNQTGIAGGSGSIGAAGGAGTNSSTASVPLAGSGGAGGAASTSGASYAGGAGGRNSSGGGGGGASLNGNNSGAGGAGAAGIVVVISR